MNAYLFAAKADPDGIPIPRHPDAVRIKKSL
jgi:hypothetical protein